MLTALKLLLTSSSARQWIFILASSVLIGTLVYFKTSASYNKEIEAINNEHSLILAELNIAADAETNRINNKIMEAQNAAVERDNQIRIDADNARNSIDRLQRTIKTIKQDNNRLSREALNIRANTSIDIFEKCAIEYRNLAEKADRHVNDLRKMMDAWPSK